MWINKGSQPEQEGGFIAPRNYHEKLIGSAIKWAKENSESVGAQINIWYDSLLCSPNALINSQNFLNKIIVLDKCNIKFKDVRDIIIVKQNPHLFSEGMPLYYRIDLLKLGICYHSLKFDSEDAVVFADIEACDLRENGQRFNKKELFDKETMDKLAAAGIVRNYDIDAVENQFLQFVNDDNATLALEYNINTCMIVGTNILNCTKGMQDENHAHLRLYGLRKHQKKHSQIL